MRIVVCSDSHGQFHRLKEVVEAQPEAGLFLHLGDGLEEFRLLSGRYPDKRMQAAAGNCDWGEAAEKTGLVNAEGKIIFFTHGHTYGVKGGLDKLLEAARTAGADIVLYGHTHVAETRYVDGLYVMNPGSVSHPRNGPATYGVIDITAAGIVTNIVPLDRGRKL